MIRPELKKKAGYDIAEKIAELKLSRSLTLCNVDKYVTAPLAGFKDEVEYYSFASPHNFISQFRAPTLWLNTEDDPFIGMDFDERGFKRNPDVALCTIKSGGHVGARESIFDNHIWLIDPVVKFFQTYVKSEEGDS